MISEQQYNYLQDKVGKFQFMVSGMMSGWSPDMVKKYKKELHSINDGELLEFLWKHYADHDKKNRDCSICYYFMPYKSWVSKECKRQHKQTS